MAADGAHRDPLEATLGTLPCKVTACYDHPQNYIRCQAGRAVVGIEMAKWSKKDKNGLGGVRRGQNRGEGCVGSRRQWEGWFQC